MIIKIFTGPLNYDISQLYSKDVDEYIIGVDQGCSQLLEQSINIDMAIGDKPQTGHENHTGKFYNIGG